MLILLVTRGEPLGQIESTTDSPAPQQLDMMNDWIKLLDALSQCNDKIFNVVTNKFSNILDRSLRPLRQQLEEQSLPAEEVTRDLASFDAIREKTVNAFAAYFKEQLGNELELFLRNESTVTRLHELLRKMLFNKLAKPVVDGQHEVNAWLAAELATIDHDLVERIETKTAQLARIREAIDVMTKEDKALFFDNIKVKTKQKSILFFINSFEFALLFCCRHLDLWPSITALM